MGLAACATNTPAPVREQPPTPAPSASPSVSPAALPAAASPPPVKARVAAPPVSVGVSEGRALVARRLPAGLADRDGWATDIYTAFASLHIAPSAENICAVVAVIEQESGFHADPPVAGLGAAAFREIETRRRAAAVPQWALDAVLKLPSSDGRSYRQRIAQARSERDLSETFEDFIGRVPLGRQLLGNHNPVHTAGAMQVAIDFAEQQVRARRYPYLHNGDWRAEMFSRRGGLYFGIAFLLDYPAAYDQPIYRFADFNSGRYSSRNAAFQQAVALLSGTRLAADGDLLRYEGATPRTDPPSATQLALRSLAPRLQLGREAIDADLLLEKTAEFDGSRLYRRVFALADAARGTPLPRALLPGIVLKSPKIQRRLTTAWFAERVDARMHRCLALAPETALPR
ncbi:DUF1615 domain-containing protein [Rhodocyclus tenuis]|uniref:DUF1615 family protein n=1 Tax=Rhodocyclus tenuis TaxID=1066 RepID=A0A840FVM2_RHOTE|nr:DUF1615 domain-containing protein [Rhodocyclus tenuis]MBB4245774.1 hypothetical protein [Rhodocyclus tenuis]